MIVTVLKHPVLKEIAIKDFADDVALYLANDSLAGGRTTTIDVRAKQMKVLREGRLTLEQIQLACPEMDIVGT